MSTVATKPKKAQFIKSAGPKRDYRAQYEPMFSLEALLLRYLHTKEWRSTEVLFTAIWDDLAECRAHSRDQMVRDGRPLVFRHAWGISQTDTKKFALREDIEQALLALRKDGVVKLKTGRQHQWSLTSKTRRRNWLAAHDPALLIYTSSHAGSRLLNDHDDETITSDDRAKVSELHKRLLANQLAIDVARAKYLVKHLPKEEDSGATGRERPADPAVGDA